MIPRSLAALCGLFLCAAAGAQPVQRLLYRQPHMGTVFRIVLYAPDSVQARSAAEAAFARVDALEGKLSDYASDSELSLLSASSGSRTGVPLSEDLYAVLQRSQQIAALTNGAFDVTVGPFTRLWRWSRRRGALPEADALQEAAEAVGYLHLKLQKRRATLALPGMRLDLGGIAKGFAADEALSVLRARGYARALVDAGGDIAAGTAPPDAPGWKVVLTGEDWVYVETGAVASSGATFGYIEDDGVRYSHIVDPKTGRSMTDDRLVVVRAPSAMDADALSSAFSVMDLDAALRLAEEIPGVSVRIMVRREGVRKMFQTSDFGAAH